MVEHLRDIIRSKELLEAWTWRIVRARYQQSLLGGLWAIIQPASTVVIFSIVFTRFVKVDTGGIPYVLFSYATVVPWTLFSASLIDMISSLVDNMNLVTKIYFPREVLPIAAMLGRLFDFGIATILLVALMIYYGVPLLDASWTWIPVVLGIQIALALGLGFIGAALNVFYRDVKHLITLGLQLWLYASPVIYPLSVVPKELQTLYFLNPMAGIIEAYRDVLLLRMWPSSYLAWSAFSALVILFVGYWFFKRVEFQFADVV
jgi:homopolymeric O-antigen transport system permease protein